MVLGDVGPSALWYLTRATGSVCLLLLTVSVALGVANVGRVQSARWPRFVLEGIHRNASLLGLVVLFVHIVTSLLDPFAGIRLIDAAVPFTSSYRPLWLGLGAFASDLLIAVALTSVVRRRLGHGAWRATHWLAYLCWLLALVAVCALSVLAAVWIRISIGWPERRGLRVAALAASIALPAAFLIWLPDGPLAKDWARRAGTPPKDLISISETTPTGSPTSGATSPAASRPVPAFSAAVNGTTAHHQSTGGLVTVQIQLTVAHQRLSALDVRIVGAPTAGGGVQMTSSTVSLGNAADPTLYSGTITALEGTDVTARVEPARGPALLLSLSLRIDPSNAATTGMLQVTPSR